MGYQKYLNRISEMVDEIITEYARETDIIRNTNPMRHMIGHDLEKLRDVDWVLEAVTEKLDIKESLFKRIEGYLKPTAILTSNTSGLSAESMAANWFGRLGALCSAMSETRAGTGSWEERHAVPKRHSGGGVVVRRTGGIGVGPGGR